MRSGRAGPEHTGESAMFFELIRQRRSIRRFTSAPVEPENIELLKEAALRAPSSRGLNPWEFVFVTDAALLDKLSRAKPHGATFLKNAPLGIVICADPKISDVWVEDASIATIFLHLAAAALDLGSCWIQIRKRQHADGTAAEAYIRDLLQIPERLAVAAMLAVGHPDEKKPPHPKQSLQEAKLFADAYGRPFGSSG
jgi:nitroreductase